MEGNKKGIKERRENDENDATDWANKIENSDWTLEMKVNLVKIDRDERKKGRGFVQRIKEVWNNRYRDKPLTVQCLRDNAPKI